MKKKGYQKPAMVVVKLQHRAMLLQESVQLTSTMSAKRRGYGLANDGVANEELNESGEWEWN